VDHKIAKSRDVGLPGDPSSNTEIGKKTQFSGACVRTPGPAPDVTLRSQAE